MQFRDVVAVTSVPGKQAWSRPVLGSFDISLITQGGSGTTCDNANTIGNQNTSCQNSDIRLKRDIHEVGATPDGLKLYSFRYNWSDETFVGVMAQEVLDVKPEAVITREDGFYAVDYDMLGLTMISLDKWRETRRVH